jgi:alpha-beta hydrolase superfamily lysophospholipase
MSVPPFPAAPEAATEDGFLYSGDHTRLYWRRYRPVVPRGTVAVFHGGGDHAGRYPALVGALVRGGFTVALVDFRGHGQSDGRRWAIDSFSDYLADADAFLQAQRSAGAGPLFLLGHGTGALIAARWSLDHAGAAAGFIFAAPTFGFGPAAPPLGRRRARLLGGLLPRHGLTARVAPAHLTTDPEVQEWIGRDPLRGTATTARWFTASLAAQREVQSAAPGFDAPLLLLTGGDDQIADGRASQRFFAAASSADKKRLIYEGFRHDLFNERGRERPLADVVAWIQARAG